MDNANVIDLKKAKEALNSAQENLETAIQDDLTSAIKLLIKRLRDAKPLQQTG